MDHQERKAEAMLNGRVSAMAESCPLATTDVHENTKNRNWTINEFGYGPMNPDVEDNEFWQAKADIFNTSIDVAKTTRCGNCAAFDQTWKIMCCIDKGINERDTVADPAQVIMNGNLGYCQLFKFKCAGDRTCDAWVHGGPIRDEHSPDLPVDSGSDKDIAYNEMEDVIDQLHNASSKHKKQAERLARLKEYM